MSLKFIIIFLFGIGGQFLVDGKKVTAVDTTETTTTTKQCSQKWGEYGCLPGVNTSRKVLALRNITRTDLIVKGVKNGGDCPSDYPIIANDHCIPEKCFCRKYCYRCRFGSRHICQQGTDWLTESRFCIFQIFLILFFFSYVVFFDYYCIIQSLELYVYEDYFI